MSVLGQLNFLIFIVLPAISQAALLGAGELQSASAHGSKALVTYLEPGKKGFQSESFKESVMGSHSRDCRYELRLPNLETKAVKTLALARGNFLDGALQKKPENLQFYDSELRVYYQVDLGVRRVPDLPEYMQISALCYNKNPSLCPKAGQKFELHGECDSTSGPYPKSQWKVLAVGRTVRSEREKIVLEESPEPGKVTSKSSTTVDWDGSLYLGDSGLNQGAFDNLEGTLLNPAENPNACEFRVRFAPWNANVTASSKALDGPEYALAFKGGAFVTDTSSIYQSSFKKLEVQRDPDRNSASELYFLAKGPQLFAFRFIFVFTKFGNEKATPEEISVRSWCTNWDQMDKKTDCKERFHYYALEYRCEK